MDIAAGLSTLKQDLTTILARYKVHPDDREAILEKIDEAMLGALTAQKSAFDVELTGIRSEIGVERDNVRKEVQAIKNSAVTKLSEIRTKIEEAYDNGVNDGMSDGLAQTPESKGPGTFTIVLGLFFAALAIVVIANNIFSKKDQK